VIPAELDIAFQEMGTEANEMRRELKINILLRRHSNIDRQA